ncbi:MAG: hypothetical protein KAY32_11160 [Candidatus Eisenbacteria sp.]|nr:hypothetical protein [Candidatus Eisenbacteria bacterium]
MPNEDYAIHARVHQLLQRHWIRSERLAVTTADGVVVLSGALAVEPGGGVDLKDATRCTRFLYRLRADVAAIPGVQDVVLNLEYSEA